MASLGSKGRIQYANDEINAGLIRDTATESYEAIAEVVAPQVGAALANPSTSGIVTTAVNIAVPPAVNTALSTSPRIPEQDNAGTRTLFVKDTYGRFAHYVEQPSGKTFFHSKDGSQLGTLTQFTLDGTLFTVKDSYGRASDLHVNADGHFAQHARSNIAKTKRINIGSLVAEKLPDDGLSDASPLIQKAINQANALVPIVGPLQIEIPIGKYAIRSKLTPYTGVGIAGAGRNETIFLPYNDQSFIDGSTAVNGAGYVYTDNIFSDFTVDGINQTNATYTAGIKGIFIQDMLRATFVNVTIRNTWGSAFGVDFLRDSMFLNCVGSGGRGIAATGQNPASTSGGSGFGIGSGRYPVEAVSIVGCIASNNGIYGIFIEKQASEPYYSQGFRVVGNMCAGNYIGFKDTGGRGAIIDGNHFINNLYAGVSLDKTLLTPAAGQAGRLMNNVITGNGTSPGTAYPCGIVINTAGADGYTIRGNTISENLGAGIYAPAASVFTAGFDISENTIERNAGSGIRFISSSVIPWLGIVGNLIRGNGTDAAQPTRDGITITSVTSYLSVLRNRVNDMAAAGAKTQQNGLVISGTGADTEKSIEWNDFRGNAVAGFTDSHTNTTPAYVGNNKV